VTLEFLTTALKLGESGPSCGLLWTEALLVGATSVLLITAILRRALRAVSGFLVAGRHFFLF